MSHSVTLCHILPVLEGLGKHNENFSGILEALPSIDLGEQIISLVKVFLFLFFIKLKSNEKFLKYFYMIFFKNEK